MTNNNVIVIGGGPAGIMAALTAAKSKKRVILIEKNNEIGKKLAITGGGRCNVTNTASPEDMIKKTVTNGKFLYSALNTFTSSDLMNLIKDKGVPLKVEAGGKVFPVSDRSRDIIHLWEEELKLHKVEAWYRNTVSKIIVENGEVVGIELEKGNKLSAGKVIIATGGLSYPATGSTGDGYRLAESVGHKIIPPKPSLVPLAISEDWIKNLMGISLEHVRITATPNKKKIISEGPMIFTHFGLSGPTILEMSSYLNQYLIEKSVKLTLDLIPDLSEESVERIFLNLEHNGNKTIRSILTKYLPKNLISKLLEILEIDGEIILNQLTKKARSKLLSALKRTELTASGLRSIKEAIITSGGVSVKEINPKTMESKKIKGLYFAGEVIDVDALTGGYNLQIAFSTGYLAGSNL
ncbi:BaiN/RdsA family NAD(P)/FAD-dependent oxidoreductase [Alkaliphilus transvaalensis]|uniref:NAD(P)/FAD-dependent oxidoreductase n=1 Tax=Alkaliphilus transvaalensis TaxID=114628 RepID=UPI00047E993F|nr:NAD(P)/FAD-dependent oxidoreductase [Alkaliphilus transvaalensis]